MEVILLADVKGIGKKGETKKVSDGYASNYLIPRKLAVRKTEGSMQVLNKQNEDERIKQEKLKAIALDIKEKLESITLEFKAKPQADGSLSKNVSFKEVENKLKTEFNIVIDKRYIAKFKVGQQRPTFFFSSYRKSELYCTFYIIA